MSAADADAAGRADSILEAADRSLEVRGRAAVLVLCAATLLLTGILALTRPLSHDEIFTFWVASQNSLAGVYSALLQHADNHPPLDYWLRHVSMQIMGASELGLRLPSVIAFIGTMLACFALIRRKFGAVCGLIGVSVLLASQASSTSYYARSYALVLLWTTLGLLLWRMAADHRHRNAALIGLALLFASAICLHFYAPFHVMAVVAAEAVRTVQRRKIDWAMLAAFACGAAGLPVVLPLLPYARSFSKGFWAPVTMQAMLASYGDLFVYGLPGFFVTLAAWAWFRASAFAGRGAAPLASGTGAGAREFLPELGAGLYLLALPFVIYAVAKSGSGAFLAKYCLSAVLGVAILLAYAGSQSVQLRGAALAGILGVSLAVLGAKAAAAVRSGHSDAHNPAIEAMLSQTELPVVVEAAQTFLETGQYAPPPARARLFFLDDLKTAMRYESETTDQIAMPGLARIAPFQVVDRADFLREHPHFMLLYEGGWLMQKLADDHAKMTIRYYGRTPVMDVDLR